MIDHGAFGWFSRRCVSDTYCPRDGSRTSVATINFQSFLSIDETRDGKKKTSLRDVRKPIERRDGGKRFGSPAVSSGISSTIKNRIEGAERFSTSGNSIRREGRSQAEVAPHLRFLFYWHSGAYHDKRILTLILSRSGMTFEDRFDIHWAKIYPPVISPEHSSRYSAVRMRYRSTTAMWCFRNDLSQNSRLSQIIMPPCSLRDRQMLSSSFPLKVPQSW